MLSGMATFQAKYDYSGTAPGMLSFRSGDKFVVKNRTNGDWWTVEDSKGEMGLVPVSYLEAMPVREGGRVGWREEERERRKLGREGGGREGERGREREREGGGERKKERERYL